jgi:ABC-2 type transport system ATP-binding protein
MVEHDLDASGVEVRRPTLDDVFLTMTGRSLRDEAMTGATDQAAA